MLSFSVPPPPWRRLLAPLAWAYGAAVRAHRFARLRPPPGPPPALPLWIVGSLRAGGAGKTAVVLELAKRLSAEGARVGILAYRLGGGRKAGDEALREVLPDSDWRESSDEAVLLARESGARVFATRRRDRAWRALADRGGFDVLLSDDGLMDARLAGASRIVLARPGERPGPGDLLPAGPYRLTASVLDGLGARDRIWYGPLEENEAPPRGTEARGTAGHAAFRREAVPPEGMDLGKAYWGLCGLGDPAAFRRALERAGVRVAGISAGPDHGLPDLGAARRAAREAGAAGFVYSAKDAIKLEGRLSPAESAGRIGEKVTFVPEPPLLPGPWHASPRALPSS